jgi:tetratricopeptide (TPR) repeat protein
MLNIFISYSHEDEEWKDALISQVKILGVDSRFSIYSDRLAQPGDAWAAEIEAALKKADVAILLISADYLTSNFIINKEIPVLLELSEKEKLKIIPLIVKPCPWEMVSWLSRLPVFPGDGIPLASSDKYQIQSKLTKLVSKITKFKSKYEIKLSRRAEGENLISYRVTITPTGKENFFEICWFDLSKSTENCFVQAGPDFVAQGMDRWWQNQEGALNIGRELFKFLDGDLRHFQRALAEANKHGIPLYLQLKTPDRTADWPFELLAQAETFLLPQRLHLVRRVSEWTYAKDFIPAARPLKLLFMACSPLYVEPELDFEREEETIFHVTENLPVDMEVEDSGTLEGLRGRLMLDRYDVVHLSGHGGIDKEGQPFFVMEDETGKMIKVTPGKLWQEALIENPPRLLFLSGNRTGEIPGGTAVSTAFSFGHDLLRNYNIPALLAWGGPVGDQQASFAAQVLYRELSRGKSILDAVQRARYELMNAFAGAPSSAWGLLRLLGSGGSMTPMVNVIQKGQPKPRRMIHFYLEQSRVKVLQEGFINRRRQLQHSLWTLNQDLDKIGILLLGTAGLGKSALAGKICERFTSYTLIIVHGIFNAVTLENALKDAFLLGSDEEGKNILGQKKKVADKLVDLCLSCFKEKNYLILLDDFEQNLEGVPQGKPGPLLPETTELLRVLLKYLPFSGKMTQLLVTSRYQFSLEEQGLDLVIERLEFIRLTGFREGEQRKKVRELPHIFQYPDKEVVSQLISAGCGNPRLMEWLDILVGQMIGKEVPELLAAVADKREEFIRAHVLRELVNRGGTGMPVFLGWLCIYRRPTPEQGIEAAAGKAGIINWRELLKGALVLSLVEHDQALQTYAVTPLLREELLAGVAEKKLRDGHEAAFAYYKGVCDPMGDDMDPLLVEEWIYHALACGEEEVAVHQGGRLVTYLRERLAYLESRRVGEWILVEKKQKLITGVDAFLLNELAFTIDALGDYHRAIDYYEQALSIDRVVYGEQHPNVARELNNLGESWKYLGKYNKAIAYYQQALSIDRVVFGEQHPNVARELNNLGETYAYMGEYHKAIEYYQKALTIDRAVVGEQHPNVARELNNLGLAWRELGDTRKAIDYYQKALAIDLAVFGKQHPHVARELNNLGDAWRNLGDPKKAIGYLEQALIIDRAVFGEEHPHVARELNNLGRTYFDLGQRETARGYLTKAYAIYKKFFGDNHPDTKNTAKGLEKCSRY